MRASSCFCIALFDVCFVWHGLQIVLMYGSFTLERRNSPDACVKERVLFCFHGMGVVVSCLSVCVRVHVHGVFS